VTFNVANRYARLRYARGGDGVYDEYDGADRYISVLNIVQSHCSKPDKIGNVYLLVFIDNTFESERSEV
jgi:hypothetical protein